MEEEEEKEKKGETQKKNMVEKVQRKHCKSFYFEEERGCERKGKQKGSPTPQSETDPGEDWATCQRCSRRTAEKVQGGRWAEEIPQRWRQPKGEDRTEMNKEAKLLRCTLQHGSAWSTERKYMRRYKGKCNLFFGIEHRLRKEEMDNGEATEGWRLAASAARITDETAGSEDHTSRQQPGSRGAVASIPGNEGRLAQAFGEFSRRYASFFGVLLALRRVDPEERSPAGGSDEASQGCQTFLAGFM